MFLLQQTYAVYNSFLLFFQMYTHVYGPLPVHLYNIAAKRNNKLAKFPNSIESSCLSCISVYLGVCCDFRSK